MSARLTNAELEEILAKASIPYMDKPFWKTIANMAAELKELRDHVESIAETGACCGPCDWFGICPACTIRLELKP